MPVQTDEGQALAAVLNLQYDSVLRYMMKRGMTRCRYEPSSAVVIAAARDGQYPASKTIDLRRSIVSWCCRRESRATDARHDGHQCTMPNAQCSMPNAQCSMPNKPLSILTGT
jgi:hypothetical protein